MCERVVYEITWHGDGAQYAVRVIEDELTTGERVYVAMHPELPGCHGQGNTVKAAVADLDEARALYLSHFAEYGLVIPPPNAHLPRTVGASTSLIISLGG